MLENSLKEQLKSYLENLQKDVVLEASLDDSKASIEMRELLEDISSLSEKVEFSDKGNFDKKPSFAIKNKDSKIDLRFAAIPLGHEFTSLVLAMLQVGGHPVKLSLDTIEQIKKNKDKLNFTTYMSLTCQNCPDVVQALNVMSVINPNISNLTIDGALFKEEVENKNIMAVPNVYLNGEEFLQGRTSVEEVLKKLGSYDDSAIVEKINAKDVFDVLVVGGGPAGASAAIYAARKDIRTAVVAERMGGQILDTLSIENFISVKHTEGPKLANALEEHMKEYNIDLINLQTAQSIDEVDGIYHVTCKSGAILKAKTIIISTGARWRKMGVAGEDKYLGKGIAFCAHCDGPLFKDKSIAVVGGGNSGVEAAIDLSNIVKDITLIEFADELKADPVLQSQMSKISNIKVITSAKISEVYGDGNKLTSADYIDIKTDKKHNILLDGIFVQIGLLPNTDWLKGTVDLSPRGEIVIDDRCNTSKTGIFAAGDVTTVPYKQIIIAMGEGAKASLSAFDHIIRTK